MVRDTTPDYVEAAEVYGVELERVLPVRAPRARLEAGRRPGESLEPRRRRDTRALGRSVPPRRGSRTVPRLTGGAATARLPGEIRLRGEPLSAGLRARGRARRGDKDVPRPRRNLLGSPVAAAAVSAEYPRRGRGAAATRLHRKTLAEYSDVRPGRYKKELEEGDGWDKPGPDFDASATVFSAQWINAAGRSLGPVEGLRPAVARRPLDGEAASAAERARPPLAPTARARRTSSLRRREFWTPAHGRGGDTNGPRAVRLTAAARALACRGGAAPPRLSPPVRFSTGTLRRPGPRGAPRHEEERGRVRDRADRDVRTRF